jgi:subtilisin-like proprotein convertase family protein
MTPSFTKSILKFRTVFLPLLLFVTSLSTVSNAQSGLVSFTDTNSRSLPDQQSVCIPITVSGLPTAADTNYGLISVCFNISHTYLSDLRVSLRNPAGDELILAERNGGSGRNFIDACFSADAIGRVDASGPPFTGSWRPMGNFNSMNEGQAANGVWSLCIFDLAAADSGRFHNVTLTFGNRPPQGPALPPGPCSMNTPGSCLCPDGSDTCDLLPDMTASADILTDRTETPGMLRISNATPNIGYGPLEIHGTQECYCDTVRVACNTPCPNGAPIKEKIIQTVYRKEGNRMVSRTRPAGYMAYHPNHGHVHVEDWSQFTIRERIPNRSPLEWPIVALGAKVSFCLVNLSECTRANGHCRGADNQILVRDSMPNQGLGTVSGCSRDQGIYPGMVDIYSQGLAGQEVNLDNLCNGNYYLVSHTDPLNNILESNDSNNVVFAPITLSRQNANPPQPVFSSAYTNGVYTFRSTNVATNNRFIWDFGDGTLDSVSNPIRHTYAQAGQYVVRLTVKTPCGGVSSATRSLVITSSDPSIAYRQLGLSAYPNPASSSINLAYSTPLSGEIKIGFYNALGQLAYSEARTITAPGTHTLKVNCASLPRGHYTVRIVSAAGPIAKGLALE